MTKEVLKEMLKDLIPMIEGRWWLCGGGMLGLHRDGDLIEWDNDLDIMLHPEATINIPSGSKYATQKYYMDEKFYDTTRYRYTPNLWHEYLRYYGHGKNMNRPTLYKAASVMYKQNSIIPEFTLPYIDIYRLQKIENAWTIPYWEQDTFYNDELANPVFNYNLGFCVPLPSNLDSVCERCYGQDWRTPIKDPYKLQ